MYVSCGVGRSETGAGDCAEGGSESWTQHTKRLTTKAARIQLIGRHRILARACFESISLNCAGIPAGLSEAPDRGDSTAAAGRSVLNIIVLTAFLIGRSGFVPSHSGVNRRVGSSQVDLGAAVFREMSNGVNGRFDWRASSKKAPDLLPGFLTSDHCGLKSPGYHG